MRDLTNLACQQLNATQIVLATPLMSLGISRIRPYQKPYVQGHGQGNAMAEEMAATDKIKAMPMAGAMGIAICSYGPWQRSGV